MSSEHFNALLFSREPFYLFQMPEPRDQVFEVRLTKAEVAWLDRIRKLKKHREPDVSSMLQKLTEKAVEIPLVRVSYHKQAKKWVAANPPSWEDIRRAADNI